MERDGCFWNVIQSSESSRGGLTSPEVSVSTAEKGRAALQGSEEKEGLSVWGAGGQPLPLPYHLPSLKSARLVWLRFFHHIQVWTSTQQKQGDYDISSHLMWYLYCSTSSPNWQQDPHVHIPLGPGKDVQEVSLNCRSPFAFTARFSSQL